MEDPQTPETDVNLTTASGSPDLASFRWSGRRSTTSLPPDTDDARTHLVDAALACFDRFGIDRTTMDDIAREAKVSRPMIYRYFTDRDSLIMSVIISRARILIDEVRRFIDTQTTFEDALVEGLLRLVELARLDPYVRALIRPDHMGLAAKLIGGSETAVDLTAELWDPLLETAQQSGDLAPERDRRQMCRWLLFIQLLFVGRLDLIPDNLDEHRQMLREFLLPAFHRDATASLGAR
jgi:AcrR family transcriptional regulator